MTENSTIFDFVDLSLKELEYPEIDFFYVNKSQIIDYRFIDKSKAEQDGLIAWKPINSLIQESEINELEQTLKAELPNSFKIYLQYKNFIELSNLSDVSMFTPLFPKIWSEKIIEQTFRGYPKEYIFDKGLIPFANYSDWGLTCFNTNNFLKSNEYEIVYWDHERPDEFYKISNDFASLLADIIRDYNQDS